MARPGKKVGRGVSEPDRREYRLLRGVVEATHRLLTEHDYVTAVSEALGILRIAAEVDRTYVFEHFDDPNTGERLASERFAWSRSRDRVIIDPPGFQNIRYQAAGLGDWHDRLAGGGTISGPVRALSDRERAFFERRGVRSLLLAPILIAGRLWGSIGFDDCESDRLWSREEESILTNMAASLGAVIGRKTAEEARSRLLTILDATTDYVGIVDVMGRENYLNPAGRRMLGIEANADVTGNSLPQPSLQPEWARRLVVEEGVPVAVRDGAWSGETALLARDGREIPVSQVIVAHKDAAGRVQYFSTVARDISQQKRYERQTTALLEVVKDISGTLDQEEIFDRVQRQTAALLPCERVVICHWDEEKGLFRLAGQFGIPDRLLPDAVALEFEPDRRLVARMTEGEPAVVNDPTRQPPPIAEQLQHFGIGALVLAPLFARGHLLGAIGALNAEGGPRFGMDQVRLLVNIARQLALSVEAADLYRAQQIETRVLGALARIGSELMSSLDTVSLLDRLCRLTTEVLGCECSYALLRDAEGGFYVPMAGYGEPLEQWERLRQCRIPRDSVPELPAFDEDDVVELSAATSPDAARMAVGLGIALRRGRELVGIQTVRYRGRQARFTITQKRMGRGIAQIASAALENARLVEELQKANRLKAEFVATMSHELRTPLNVILGYGDLLLEGAFGPVSRAQGDTLRRMGRSAGELLHVVNATLNVGRIESGQMSMSVEEVHLPELLEEVKAETVEARSKPDVRVEWQVPQDLPSLETDPVMFKVVLKNVISNAFKFTDAGAVRIEALNDGSGVTVSVADTGIGIPPEAHAAIFEPFRQVDASMTRRHGGVGVGLYIARRLLDLMGGGISVRSEPGRGSCFSVWLPRRAPDVRAGPGPG